MADRSRLTANLLAVGLVVAVVAGIVAWQRPWASPDRVAGASMPPDARSLIVRQFQQVSSADSRAEFVAAFGTSDVARAVGRHVWDAEHVLGVGTVRYAHATGGGAADRADGTTSAVVTVTWRGGSSDARFRLRPRSDGFDIISVSNAGAGRLPVWLAGGVAVARSPAVSVITVDGGSRDLDPAVLARRGRAQVERLIPDITGNLTVVAPRRVATTAAVLGRRPSQVSQVAAVSSNLEGLGEKPAVVLNPALFAEMDARARQVIMTHEATHVLTGVTKRKVTLWVAEGFADYVALHDDRAPLSVSAGQILRRVKAKGAPATLPSAKDFDESAHGFGTAYEAAWMAFRMLGTQFGDAAVGDFYRDVVSGASVGSAAEEHFGMTTSELTAAWRAYLTKSASTVS